MVSLADLVPQTETVAVRGTDLTVSAVTAQGLAALIRDFPDMGKLLDGKIKSPAAFLSEVPHLAVALMAHGLGVADKPDEVAALARFAAGDQAAILAAVFRLTSPGGIVPFVQLIEALGGAEAIAAVKASRAPATTSPSPSNS